VARSNIHLLGNSAPFHAVRPAMWVPANWRKSARPARPSRVFRIEEALEGAECSVGVAACKPNGCMSPALCWRLHSSLPIERATSARREAGTIVCSWTDESRIEITPEVADGPHPASSNK